MSTVELNLERRPEDYEGALDSALSAMRETWDCTGDEMAAIEELRSKFRTLGI